MRMKRLGWDAFFEDAFASFRERGLRPARVVRQDRGSYLVSGETEEWTAEMLGRMRHAVGDEGPPAVGDWVAVEPGSTAVIHGTLPRKSRLSRKVAWTRTDEQVVAANVDTVFLVSGLDGGRGLNLRRLERCLTLTWESGAAPVVLLNKMDLCPDVASALREAESAAFGVPVHAVSALYGTGMDAPREHLTEGKTAVFLGMSGVGKSALINALLGSERQDTGPVRGDDRSGRHTTTRRELILLPGGGAVIDTPGIREIQLWAEEGGLEGAFEEIETLASECRFRDCRHSDEPGCAVKLALEEGRLDPRRHEHYLRLKKELAHLARRKDQKARLAEKAKWRKISRWSRQLKKDRE